ncbi:unnamed protein product, partial [Pylaiella littoralis]
CRCDETFSAKNTPKMMGPGEARLRMLYLRGLHLLPYKFGVVVVVSFAQTNTLPSRCLRCFSVPRTRVLKQMAFIRAVWHEATARAGYLLCGSSRAAATSQTRSTVAEVAAAAAVAVPGWMHTHG